jgi:hypothetical protein
MRQKSLEGSPSRNPHRWRPRHPLRQSSAGVRATGPVMSSSTMDDFEEPDLLPVAVPLADVPRSEVEPDFASLSLRHTKPDEPVTDHEREAPPPRRVQELEPAGSGGNRVTSACPTLDAFECATGLSVQDARGPANKALRDSACSLDNASGGGTGAGGTGEGEGTGLSKRIVIAPLRTRDTTR